MLSWPRRAPGEMAADVEGERVSRKFKAIFGKDVDSEGLPDELRHGLQQKAWPAAAAGCLSRSHALLRYCGERADELASCTPPA